jgi:hypothetical protein
MAPLRKPERHPEAELASLIRPFEESIICTWRPPSLEDAVYLDSFESLVRAGARLGRPIHRAMEPRSGLPGGFFYVPDVRIVYCYEFLAAHPPDSPGPAELSPGTALAAAPAPAGNNGHRSPPPPRESAKAPRGSGRASPPRTAPVPLDQPTVPAAASLASVSFADLAGWFYAQAETMETDTIAASISRPEVVKVQECIDSGDKAQAEQMLRRLWARSQASSR